MIQPPHPGAVHGSKNGTPVVKSTPLKVEDASRPTTAEGERKLSTGSLRATQQAGGGSAAASANPSAAPTPAAEQAIDPTLAIDPSLQEVLSANGDATKPNITVQTQTQSSITTTTSAGDDNISVHAEGAEEDIVSPIEAVPAVNVNIPPPPQMQTMPMQGMMTEDGEPMMNPSELFTQVSAA
jgi:hypothetical protein